ncbi:MAG: hypothetical protein Q9O74_04415 [Planctomycetota bacterium]|nr:hypothetical protein [Planctomycetota bacterium]
MQAQTEDDVRAWFADAWLQAAATPSLPGFRIELHVEYPPQYTDEHLAALRRQAEGKPDHPNWTIIRAEERRRRQPFDASRITIWTDDREGWRYSRSYLTSTTDKPSYIDAVVSDSVMWQLTPEELHVADSRDGTATGAHGDARLREGAMRTYLRELLLGRLGNGADNGFGPDGRIEVLPDGRWAAYVAHPERGAHRFEGTWDASLGRGFVETIEIVETPDEFAKFRGTRYEIAGWYFDDTAQRWLARTASEISPDGVVDHKTVLDAVMSVTPDELDAVFAVPPVEGSDPVRGEVTFRSLYDHRPTALARHDLGPDRAIVGSTDLSGASSFRRWRVGGWVLAGVLIAGFVWLRFRAACSSP